MLVSRSSPGACNVAIAMRPVLSRGIGYSTIPKLIVNLVRVPALIGATFTAGIVYVQYKVEGESDRGFCVCAMRNCASHAMCPANNQS